MKHDRDKWYEIIDKADKILKDPDIENIGDFRFITFAAMSSLAWSIAENHPDDRSAQLRLVDELAKRLRESLERADPDAITLQ